MTFFFVSNSNSFNAPVYSGKQTFSGDFLIFSSNKSFLFRNSIMEVSVNHLLLQMESNSFMLSIIRFWSPSKLHICNIKLYYCTTKRAYLSPYHVNQLRPYFCIIISINLIQSYPVQTIRTLRLGKSTGTIYISLDGTSIFFGTNFYCCCTLLHSTESYNAVNLSEKSILQTNGTMFSTVG